MRWKSLGIFDKSSYLQDEKNSHLREMCDQMLAGRLDVEAAVQVCLFLTVRFVPIVHFNCLIIFDVCHVGI